MLEIGSLVDRKYRILRKIGQGGMSVVYMALNERANKTWAIKEVRKEGVQNFDVVKQGLIVETELLKRLHHPSLPSIVDVIEDEDSFLIVMDYIEGRSLKNILDENGAQTQEDVIDWAKQLCDVLGYLHSRKPPVIYRDMKPSNVMLKPNGDIVLFDFGTAREYKSTRDGDDTYILGTKGYAAPEQYGGQGQTDARTDIYCLGATMYHLLTGHNPSQPPYQMYPIRHWNTNFSTGLENIILKCTQANPADRYRSCAELLYDLEHFEEVDQTYRKHQLRTLWKFMIPTIVAVAFGISAVTFHFLETSAKNHTYAVYLQNAEQSSGEDRISYYREAINLDPETGTAWDALLEECTRDYVFTAEESSIVQTILMTQTTGNQSNEALFQSGNPQGYEDFCYALGIAYYYYLEDGNNKTQAKHYFEIAKDSEFLNDQQRARAERLYKIAAYYDSLGVLDSAGDTLTSYQEYWEDLTALAAGNLVEMDNPTTAIIVYRELTTQIISHSYEFKNAGVEASDMLAQLEGIEEHLTTDFQDLTETQQDSIQNIRASLEESIAQAKWVINATYDGRSEE